MWFAGIDWADTHHDAVVVDEAGNKVAAIRVPHSAGGLEQLKGFLIASANDKTPHKLEEQRERDCSAVHREIACIVEINHGLLITALLEAGFAVYPVNPKTIERHRAASGAKTDAIDAYLLAKKGRSDWRDLRRLAPDTPLIQELKALTRDLDGVIQMQTRLVNQLTACLKSYFPVALELFAKVQQPLTLAFLERFPTLAAACAATPGELQAFLTKQVPTYRGPTAAAQKLWDRLHEPQLCADAVTERTKARLMLVLVRQLAALLPAIAAYEEAIAALFSTHTDAPLFDQLPGAGKRLAPRLLAEWGDDRTRYANAAAIQSLAGTSPVPYASGKYARVRKRFACSKPMRNTLYQFAWQSTRQEAWSQSYYQRKRAEGKSHSVAVRALANLWVRILYAVWSTRHPYEAAIFLAAQQRHSSMAA